VLVYLAHPVGQGEERAKNLENVNKWFLFLIEHTDWSLCVPWFIYVTNLDETYRSRAMRDDLVNLERCDAIVLTGGKLTGGMKAELGLAEFGGKKIFDLISAGYEPGPEALALLPINLDGGAY
jgi:hypothetical protein